MGLGSCCLSTCSSSSFKTNRTFVTYEAMDEIQIAEINSQVRRYLEGTLDEIDVRNPSVTTVLSQPGPPYPGHTPTHALLASEPHMNGCSGWRVVLDS